MTMAKDPNEEAQRFIDASNGETPMPSGGPVGVGSDAAKPRKATARKPRKAAKKK